MNISAINNSFMNSLFAKDQDANGTPSPAAPLSDIVTLNELPDLTDAEVENLMNETIQMIGADAAGALSVHNGLDPNRVYSLLGLA